MEEIELQNLEKIRALWKKKFTNTLEYGKWTPSDKTMWL